MSRWGTSLSKAIGGFLGASTDGTTEESRPDDRSTRKQKSSNMVSPSKSNDRQRPSRPGNGDGCSLERDEVSPAGTSGESRPVDGSTRKRKSSNMVSPSTSIKRQRPRKAGKGDDCLLKGDGRAPETDLMQNDEEILHGLTAQVQKCVAKHPHYLNLLRDNILSGLTGNRRLPLIHLSKPYSAVHALVSQTIRAGEGNSMLVVGPRGTGKTAIVETVLADLGKEHHEDFLVVRLNGFIHTDDKLALKEIWHQVGREQNPGLSNTRINIADTLTSLLALLSYDNPASERPKTASKAVVLVLDEFDQFATHARQTLLYNLFDLAQSSPTPIAVLGLTTKVSVMDFLEKRVKSRFGQRFAYVHPARTFDAFREICLNALFFHPSTMVHRTLSFQAFSQAWNDHVRHLFTASSSLSRLLQGIYATSKSVPAFCAAALLPMTALSPETPTLSAAAFSVTQPPAHHLYDVLAALSSLGLTLLIAAARLEILLTPTGPLALTGVQNTVKSLPAVTFLLVYEEYLAMLSRNRISASSQAGAVRVWSKTVAGKEWAQLERVGLLVATSAAAHAGAAGESGTWRPDVSLEEIGDWLELEKQGFGISGSAHFVGVSGLIRWCREL